MPLPNVLDWTDKEKLAGEKELLGFWVTGHPLDRYAEKVAELATHDSSNLEGLAKGVEVKLCGVWLGRNGALDRAMDRAGALGGVVQAEAGRDGSAAAFGSAAGFFTAAGCGGEGAAG